MCIQDYINDYINATSQSSGVKSSSITKAGKQKLDGVQAVAYSRIRYTAGGDYKRTERMRTVLTEVFNKAKKMSVADLNNVLDKVLPEVYTNITKSDILALIPQIASYSIVDSKGWPYETKGITLNGVWYGPPINLEKNVSQLHKELFAQDDYVPTDKVKEISNKIPNPAFAISKVDAKLITVISCPNMENTEPIIFSHPRPSV